MRSRLALWLLLFVFAVTAAVAPMTAASARVGQVSATAHVLTPAPPCPSEDSCVSIPNDPPGCSGVSCATVQVGPTRNLGSDQFVYIHTYGFTPKSNLHINYCDNSPAAPHPVLCLTAGTALISNTDYVAQTLSDGTESLSYQVLEDDTSDPPLIGQDPGNPQTKGTFFCDSDTPCSVDITDTSQDGGSFGIFPDNTAIVPISFASNASVGCAASATSVTTESEFGMEFVLPQAALDSCNDAHPSLAFNTAQDGLGAVTALAAGAAQVAFTDDPESASQLPVLQQGNFKLIPVALTANVVGFRAQQLQDQFLFPLNSLDLTPSMVAGLLTGIYNTPLNNDPITCSHTAPCAIPPCPVLGKGAGAKNTCSLFDQANFESGFLPPQGYEAFVRSDTAGSTGLLFNWLCNAPVNPVSVVGGLQLADPNSAATVLKDAFGTLSGPLPACPQYDQYPPEALGSTVTYNAFNGPDQQSIKMFGYVNPGGGGSNVLGAFSTMNWAEARFYGLSIASLQNGAGQFVAPSQASLDAAVLDSPTVNADGTITPNYTDKTDTDIYPMTSVEYAAVCADPVPTAQASAETNMLNQLLDVTGGSDSGQLPDGFVPLPSTLVTQAQKDIAADVQGGGAPGGACPGGGGSAPSGGGAPGGGGTAGGSSPITFPGLALGVSGGSAPVSPNTGKATLPVVPAPQTLHFGSVGLNGKGGTGGPGAAGGGTNLGLFTLTASSSRLLLPLALLLGLLALVFGGLMLAKPGFRNQVLAFSLASGRWIRGAGRRTTSGLGQGRGWLVRSAGTPKAGANWRARTTGPKRRW